MAFITVPSPTMSAAIGGGGARFYPHQSLRSWWGLATTTLYCKRWNKSSFRASISQGILRELGRRGKRLILGRGVDSMKEPARFRPNCLGDGQKERYA